RPELRVARMRRRPAPSTRLPSTTLFRSVATAAEEIAEQRLSAILVAPENYPEELADALEARDLRVPADVSMLLLGQPLHPRHGGRSWSGFAVPREEMGARALVLLSRIVDQESRTARAPEGRMQNAPSLDEADYHQMLDCPDIDGASLAPAPATTQTTEGIIRDHA